MSAPNDRTGTGECMNDSSTNADGVERVAVSGLRRRHRVRRALDVAHVERLAEVLDRCPPILIGSDGTLIDGEHRVAAAQQLGTTELPAIVLRTDSDSPVEGLISAIETNTSHGLPLSREERRDAVEAVLAAKGEMSDREIARVCGVSRGLVATIREATSRSGGSTDHLNGRIGRDGKRYGTLPQGWHAYLEALVRVDPATSIRALAERTGASVGAVQARRRDLLQRIEGELRFVRWWRRLRARWLLRLPADSPKRQW